MDHLDAVLERLMAVVADRKQNPRPNSYTNTLLTGGVDRIGTKILEEAQETVDAAREAGSQGQQHLIHETADLIYHLLVLLAARDVSLPQIEAELARRFGISGLDEKASRSESKKSGER